MSDRAGTEQTGEKAMTDTPEQEQKIRDIARRHGIFIRGTSAMLREAYQAGREQGRREENEVLLDAAMIIRRIVRRLAKSDRPGDATIVFETVDWLKRKGLQGSILRPRLERSHRGK